MKAISFVLVGLLTIVTGALAQTPTPEFRPFFGAYVPTGDQRHVLKDAILTGMQFGLELQESVHLIGTLAWSPSEDEQRAVDNRVDLFQYDVGAEIFRSTDLSDQWIFRPFLGLGLGARTYDFRDSDLDRKTYLTGYGALGTEFQTGQIAIRLEGRDYLSQFKGLAGDQESRTRNDLALMAGLSFHIW